MKVNYKKFIEVSKWLVAYDTLNILGKLWFWVQSPLAYKKFKKRSGGKF